MTLPDIHRPSTGNQPLSQRATRLFRLVRWHYSCPAGKSAPSSADSCHHAPPPHAPPPPLLPLQCEATQFSMLTFFPDRPDILSHWQVRVEAPRTTCPVLLSNGNLLEAGQLADGRHFTIWEVSCVQSVLHKTDEVLADLQSTGQQQVCSCLSCVHKSRG